MEDLNKILTDLNSKDETTIEKALDDIGKSQIENSLELILPFLKHVSKKIRETAVFNLGEINNVNAVPYIIERISTDQESVRMFAFFALENYKNDIIFEVLKDELYKPGLTSSIRQRISEQLRNYPSEESRKMLLDIINTGNDKNAIVFAADSLFLMNDKSLLEAWENILQYQDHPYLVDVATQAIKDIKNKNE